MDILECLEHGVRPIRERRGGVHAGHVLREAHANVDAQIELQGLLRRPELGEAAGTEVDTQLAEQRPHADGTDDLGVAQSVDR